MHVDLLIKSASSLCNMRYRYCFYEDEAANRAEASLGRMSQETAALLIRQELDAEWAVLLAEKRFLTGISLDGDKDLRDSLWVDAAGKGTWNRVQKTCACSKRPGPTTTCCAWSPAAASSCYDKGDEPIEEIRIPDPGGVHVPEFGCLRRCGQ